jgi:hypothetical protein
MAHKVPQVEMNHAGISFERRSSGPPRATGKPILASAPGRRVQQPWPGGGGIEVISTIFAAAPSALLNVLGGSESHG